MVTATVILGAIVFFAVGFLTYYVTVYNGLVQLKNNMEKAWANIDVILKQRHDELPKLVDVCKGYMKYEKETLERIIQARNTYQKAPDIEGKTKAANEMTGALRQLFALAENYPDLKANQNFLHVQNRVSGLEDQIADRREFFNESVNAYNIRINQIPDVFVARTLNYQSRTLLEVSEEEKKDVKLEF